MRERILKEPFPHLLISMKNLQKGFVDFGLVLEAILDLVHIIDGMIKLNGLLSDGGKLAGYRDGGGDAMSSKGCRWLR